MSDFSSERHIKKARKRRICEHCGRPIEIGSPAEMLSGVWDGDFGVVYMHSDCRQAGLAYAELSGLWGDEWTWLHQLEERTDFEWLAAEFPTVSERLGRRA